MKTIYFEERVDDLNRGLATSAAISSLKFSGMHTLYIKEGDMDPNPPAQTPTHLARLHSHASRAIQAGG